MQVRLKGGWDRFLPCWSSLTQVASYDVTGFETMVGLDPLACWCVHLNILKISHHCYLECFLSLWSLRLLNSELPHCSTTLTLESLSSMVVIQGVF